jgi:hypothetical protein
VSGIAPSPDGTRLATVGGDEGDVIVWDTTTPPPYERVARFHEDGFVGGAVWDSTGTRLIGACDKTIRIWDDTPLRERVAMRQARAAALKTVEPLVADLIRQLRDPTAVAKRLDADPSLDSFSHRLALQLALRAALAKTPAVQEAGRSTDRAKPERNN